MIGRILVGFVVACQDHLQTLANRRAENRCRETTDHAIAA
jgi:hypothetical protein